MLFLAILRPILPFIVPQLHWSLCLCVTLALPARFTAQLLHVYCGYMHAFTVHLLHVYLIYVYNHITPPPLIINNI